MRQHHFPITSYATSDAAKFCDWCFDQDMIDPENTIARVWITDFKQYIENSAQVIGEFNIDLVCSWIINGLKDIKDILDNSIDHVGI